MPESPQTTPDQYGPFARAFTIAANLLQDVDREAWTARGLGPFDVPAAQAWAGILLYAYSIELGLKDILARRMETRVPKVHDLVQHWERLTDEWRERVAKKSGVPVADIRETLGRFRNAGVNLRYGKPWGEQTEQAARVDVMQNDLEVLAKLAGLLAGWACPPITGLDVERRESAE